MVDILRDFPETTDEELARVEDREGVREVSDSGVSPCSFLLNFPERLRRDRALFTERKDDGYRSVIAERVSRNESTCPRQAQESQSSKGRRGVVKVQNISDSGIFESLGSFLKLRPLEVAHRQQLPVPNLNDPPHIPLLSLDLRRLSHGPRQEISRFFVLRRQTVRRRFEQRLLWKSGPAAKKPIRLGLFVPPPGC